MFPKSYHFYALCFLFSIAGGCIGFGQHGLIHEGFLGAGIGLITYPLIRLWFHLILGDEV